MNVSNSGRRDIQWIAALLLLNLLLMSGIPKLQAQVPKLPVPANGVYEQSFQYPISRVVPADLNGDGNLDFVSRSQHYPAQPNNGNIYIETRLYNSATTLWSFNTNVDTAMNSNHLDLAMIAWDFNNDNKWEVYHHYRQNNQWYHRIADGLTGATLVAAPFPVSWTETKVMAAIAYRAGQPRVVINIDYQNRASVWMFEMRNGSNWSLATMSGWPYDVNSGSGVAHDMIRTADVDVDGSDDEILAGVVVLNSNGTERYHLEDIVPNRWAGNADQGILGFFRPDQPNDLVYITGSREGANITAIWAKTGGLIWNHNMNGSGYFNNWDHFHQGWLRQESSGTTLLAVNKTGDEWIHIDVDHPSGQIIAMGNSMSGRPQCSGPNNKTIKWDADNDDDCYPNSYNNALDCRIDIGGEGCEEIWGLNGPNTLRITFNNNCSGLASRWDNRHYRQDGVLAASGYASSWMGALVINSGPDVTPPTISNIASTTTTSSATITWNTSEASDTQVEYGLTTSYGSSSTLNTSLVTSHAVGLTGLANTTTYHFRVKSRDAAGNLAVSADNTFTTGCNSNSSNLALSAQASASGETPAYGQTASKAIDNVIDGYPGDYTKEWASGQSSGVWLQLNWPSSTTVSSVVLYDRPNNNDWIKGGQLAFSDGSSAVTVGTLNNNGSATPVPFSARTITWMRFTVTNSAGSNLGLAEMQAFGPLCDTTPPTISNVAAGNITSSGATITWTTNETSDSQVEYGLTTSYGSSTSLDANLVTNHSVSMTGLSSNTLYHYRVKSKDAAGNSATSSDFTFTTSSSSSTNVALNAEASASGETPAYGQTASKAIDNIIDGYPGDYTKEWASGQSSGVWLQLNWSSNVSVSRVVLHDRPNTNDWIKGGQLTFSDGSSAVAVGTLNNNGSATEIIFSARTVTWVRFTVTSSAGSSLGLAEMQVWGSFGAPKQSRVNEPTTGLPESFSLSEIYPNPFNLETLFKLELPEQGQILARVYNINGKEIKTVYQGMLPAGSHTLQWDGRNHRHDAVSSGVYMIRIEYILVSGQRESITKRMTLLK